MSLKTPGILVDLPSDTIDDLELLDNSCIPSGNSAVKRKGGVNFDGTIEEFVQEDDNDYDVMMEDELDGSVEVNTRAAIRRFAVDIRQPIMVFPKSQYEGYKHRLPVDTERAVLKDFLVDDTLDEPESETSFFHSYRLDEFSVYYPHGRRLSCELAVLSSLSFKGEHILLFDGVLTDGETSRYVEGVPFDVLSVGNYLDTTKHDVNGNVWIQSSISREMGDVWYELGTPSSTYEPHYRPFVWLANFAKHFIDYLDEHENVTLLDFKQLFSRWIKVYHSGITSFDTWYAEYGKYDFRQAVVVHKDWLWNQVYGAAKVLISKHPIWDEVIHLTAVKAAPGAWEKSTVVTPYVYECFKHMYGDRLKVVAPPVNDALSECVGVEIPKPARVARDECGNLRPVSNVRVKIGDVIAIDRDEESVWAGKSAIWYAYVHTIKEIGERIALGVIWLYSPEDTILAKERYLHHNELFFSDHCNCNEPPLYVEEALCVVSVGFFKQPRESGCEFFVRQKYRHEDPAFLTLEESDLAGCKCTEPEESVFRKVMHEYEVGDTVLVVVILNGKDLLEPAEIMSYDTENGLVQLRLLERRDRVESGCRPNELLYTTITDFFNPRNLQRHCYVRFFTEADVKAGKIPTPYNRDGTGDFYYISAALDKNDNIEPFETFPTSLRQGFDPEAPSQMPKLKGLDLFCGGGNFGRGIEEGGAVSMKWAVDIDVSAIHTYRANLKHPDDTSLYYGSINNYLRDAINGRCNEMIAAPGEVEFISAGSPCQGFSNANRNPNNDKSLQNSSLVASVATSIDFYRPKYALLENVHGLATNRLKPDGQQYNVFAQLVCCMVGMGYQCQQWTLDAWSYGSPQHRTRLFLCIAAPGQKLPPRPPRSHEHPKNVKMKSLFETPCGVKFGHRDFSGFCPFPLATVGQGWGDLPHIGNNHVGICIPFPDHRSPRVESNLSRLLISHVPKTLDCNSWRMALDSGRMPQAFKVYETNIHRRRKGCKAWSRVNQDTLGSTVKTIINPLCSFSGRVLHWDQDRLITIQEARRLQSFPDDEVLVGNPANEFKIVGNSVARSVSLVLGLAFRRARFGEGNCFER
ncbi:hypothetical protein RUND412_006122 [Rhizina undulata]